MTYRDGIGQKPRVSTRGINRTRGAKRVLDYRVRAKMYADKRRISRLGERPRIPRTRMQQPILTGGIGGFAPPITYNYLPFTPYGR